MKIKKILLKNIRSYESEEIEFRDGSTLLSGDIGSGKTSVLLAIEFALFGLQPGQRGSALLRNGALEGGVVLVLEMDGKEIILERTLKKGKTITQDYCAITIDGTKEEIAVTELKDRVLEILNYPKEFAKKQNMLYKFTVYTPQEEMKQIILEDPETRINALRHVFGIDKYKKIIENVGILASKIREDKRMKEGITLNLENDRLLLVSKEDELEARHNNLSSVESQLFLKTEQRKRIQEEKEELSRKKDEKSKLQQELEKTKIIISNKNEMISENEKIISRLKAEISELSKLKIDEEEVSKIQKEILDAKNEKKKLDEKRLDVNSQITTLSMKNSENFGLEKNISALEICPTCLQNVDPNYRANVLVKLHSEISENDRNMKKFSEEKKILSEKMLALDASISFGEKKHQEIGIARIKLQGIKEKSDRVAELEKTKVLFGKDVELLSQHMESLNSSIFELKKYDSLFEAKQRELDEALREERSADIKVAELRKEIEVFSRQIVEMKTRLEKTEEVKKKLGLI